MPYRRYPIVAGEIYHVYNRSVAKQPIFLSQRDYKRALDTVYYYNFEEPKLRFSHFNRLSVEERLKYINNLKDKGKRHTQLIAFCLMPSHVHFLVKGIGNKGVSTFMTNLQHSYAKYFNAKNKRTGAVFQSMFKAVRIVSDDQLLHIARYIHLNPLTSYILRDISELENYPWSSYMDYMGKRQLDLVEYKILLDIFKTKEKLQEFTEDQVDYQRKLAQIKHLIYK